MQFLYVQVYVLFCRFLKGLMEQFNSTSDALVAKLQKFTDGKTNVSMLEEFHRISLDIIGKVCVDKNTHSYNVCQNCLA